MVTYSNSAPYGAVIDWCRTNIGEGGYGYIDPKRGLPESDTWACVYDVNTAYFYFKYEDDAVLFKMVWL